MTIDQSFDALYKLLRGSRCAAPLLNVRSLFDSGDIAQAIDELQKVKQAYESSRQSTLNADLHFSDPDDKETQQLKKRLSKASDALELMNELQAMFALQQRRSTAVSTKPEAAATKAPQSQHTSTPSNTPISKATNDEIESLRIALLQNPGEDEVRSLLSTHFEFVSILPEHRFEPAERFVIYSNGQGHVVEVDSPTIIESESLRVLNWVDRKKLLPVPLEKFHKAIARGRAQKLVPHRAIDSAVTTSIQPPIEVATVAPAKDPEIVSETADRDKILDMGAFTQLLDAAQRSGIVPGSGVIIQVRDCEYRLGRYNKALQMMETLYTSFVGAESQRNQRLQIEDNEIASGRKKMSQRDLQAKRIRDNQNSQAIDRAKVRFQRVLEGLRGLLPLEANAGGTD